MQSSYFLRMVIRQLKIFNIVSQKLSIFSVFKEIEPNKNGKTVKRHSDLLSFKSEAIESFKTASYVHTCIYLVKVNLVAKEILDKNQAEHIQGWTLFRTMYTFIIGGGGLMYFNFTVRKCSEFTLVLNHLISISKLNLGPLNNNKPTRIVLELTPFTTVYLILVYTCHNWWVWPLTKGLVKTFHASSMSLYCSYNTYSLWYLGLRFNNVTSLSWGLSWPLRKLRSLYGVIKNLKTQSQKISEPLKLLSNYKRWQLFTGIINDCFQQGLAEYVMAFGMILAIFSSAIVLKPRLRCTMSRVNSIAWIFMWYIVCNVCYWLFLSWLYKQNISQSCWWMDEKIGVQ